MLYSSINLDIYIQLIRYNFNKIVNLTKILFKSNLYNSIVKFCTSNAYKLLVQVTTCTDFSYKLQLIQNLNLYITYTKVKP